MTGEPEPEQARPSVVHERGGDPGKRGDFIADFIADGIRSRPSYAVSLDMFEGPLDLLLHLVRRHELDILDIPIAFITEKYIEYISFARALDIEVAGDYLLMAATLAFLKSRELLPVVPELAGDEDDEDEIGVDPREELIRRLIEYERFRNAGEDLAARPLAGRDVFPRGGGVDVIAPEPGLAPITLFKLAEAYNRVLDRAKVREDHEVVIEAVTVRQRMHQLSLLLAERPRVEFESLFLDRVWSNERELRAMLVVTLMSVLEMVKLGLLGVMQPHGSEMLSLERVVDVDAMEHAVADYREEDEDESKAGEEVTEAVEATDAVVEETEVIEETEAVEEAEAVVEEPEAGEEPEVVEETEAEPSVERGAESVVEDQESDDLEPPSGETSGD